MVKVRRRISGNLIVGRVGLVERERQREHSLHVFDGGCIDGCSEMEQFEESRFFNLSAIRIPEIVDLKLFGFEASKNIKEKTDASDKI